MRVRCNLLKLIIDILYDKVKAIYIANTEKYKQNYYEIKTL